MSANNSRRKSCLSDIPGALDFVAGRRIMEIDRRPLEITRVPTLRIRLTPRSRPSP